MEKNKLLIVLLVVMGIALGLSLLWHGADRSLGAAPDGFAAIMATSSSITVGGSNLVLVSATSTGCVSRVITTGATAVVISFDDMASARIGTTTGVFQATSSSVAYDASMYGCGEVSILGNPWPTGGPGSTTIGIQTYAGFR